MGEHDDSIARANGQGPITILKSGGKEYALAPLLMEDMGTVEKFARDRHRAQQKESRADTLELIREAGDLIDPEERSEWVQQLRRDVSDDGEWTWMDEMASPTVISFVITMRLQKTYPKMTQEEARSVITVSAIAEMSEEMAALIGLNAFIGDNEDEDGEAVTGEAQGA